MFLGMQLIEAGLAVFVSQFIPQEKQRPAPSLRLTVSANHTPADIKQLLAALRVELAAVTAGSAPAPMPAAGTLSVAAVASPVAAAAAVGTAKTSSKKAGKKE
jgi:hypothetical protein